MFGYHTATPKVHLTTDRMSLRLVHERDAYRLAEYYAENQVFLKPWEPVRIKVIVCRRGGRRDWE